MKRVVLCVLVLLVLAGGTVFAGGSSSSSTPAASSATKTPVGQYPVETDVTLTYWVQLHNNINPNYTNLGDTPFYKELLKRTGIKVKFEHPPSNAVAEAYNVMLASLDLPDIIEYNWTTYPGGPEKAISDGIVTRLNDAIDKWAPNLKAVLKANPAWDKWVKTDESSYYVFPFIRGDPKLLYTQGLMIRKDWLDDLGLQIPQTIQEWHDALVAFRDKKGATAPFTMTWSNRGRMFMPGFGILNDFYISADDKKVHFGPMENGYRRWLETMAQWYKEGILDKDIMTVTAAQQNTKMTTGVSGASVGSIQSGMGVWTTTARPNTPRYLINAVQYPVLNRGDKLVYSVATQPYAADSAAISATTKNLEIATRFLDFGYGTQGNLVYNFGTEGESYTMQGGKPVYTPFVMGGTDKKWPLAQAIAAWARGNMAGPFIQDPRYLDQYYDQPEQTAALSIYALQGAENYMLPASVKPTTAESSEYASITTEINTFVAERASRWVLGTDPITDATWNDYINTLRRMNIDRALAMQNAALDRFNKR